MTNHKHLTAATQYIGTDGIHFAYRHGGKCGTIPLVVTQQHTATMDH